MQLELPVSTSANPYGAVPCENPILSGLGKGNIAKICDLPGGWALDRGRNGLLSFQPASLLAACHTRRWCHSAIHGRFGTHECSSWTSLVTRFILFMANGGGRRRARQARMGKRAPTNTTAGDRLWGVLGRF